MLRLVHFSDIHVFESKAAWRAREMFSKRVTGWVNNRLLPRGKKFKDATDILKRLVDDIYRQKPDLLLFSGDATTLGVEEEFALAAKILRVHEAGSLPALAVPGNHDYYTRRSVRLGLFEKHFAPWLVGDRIAGHTYPFGRAAGPLYIVGVNSSTPGRWMWDARGKVGPAQLRRLKQLLAKPQAANLPKVLLTHYPIVLPSGRPEKRFRRLRDLPDVLDVVSDGGVRLWLHGHRHMPYSVEPTHGRPIHALCVGSGTQKDLWTYAEYTFDGKKLFIEYRAFDPRDQRFKALRREEIPQPF